MNIKIEKSEGTAWCDNYRSRRKLPQYISKRGNIKRGTTMAVIADHCYCYDCIDLIYDEIKLKLNKSLWLFK